MRYSLIIIGVVLVSCQPNELRVSEYADLQSYFETQRTPLKIKKEVWLDNQAEKMTLNPTDEEWEKELAIFKEIDPQLSDYTGAFIEEINGDQTTLTLKEGENGSLKKASFMINDGQVTSIKAEVHEDKQVYIHHKSIQVLFRDNNIKTYRVDGYQKMLFKDTVFFKIRAIVQ
jgi:hypothetical protein